MWLYGPTGLDLGLVTKLDRHPIVADWPPIPGIKNQVAIEGPYAIGNVRKNGLATNLSLGRSGIMPEKTTPPSKKKLTWLLSEGLAEIRLKMLMPLSGPPFTGR